jgi:hypothetical protein
MRRFLFLTLMLLSVASSAQKPSVAATEDQAHPLRLLLTLNNLDATAIENVSLFTLDADFSVDASGKLVQSSQNVSKDFLVGAPEPGMELAIQTLRKPLENKSYVLVITTKTGTFVSTKIDPKGTIGVGDVTIANRQVKLSSPVSLGFNTGDALVLERSRALSNSGVPTSSPVLYPGTVAHVEADGVFVELSKTLPAGKTSNLALKNGRVPAEGKIQLDAAPANESDAYVLVKANAVAAVHQAPVFTLSGSVAPLHPAAKARYWGSVQFDPSVVFDVGLRSTKTANSITVPAAFKNYLLFGLPKAGSGTDFRSRTSADPTGMLLSYGPRYETDRTFHRVNLLADVRAEGYLPFLSRSVQAIQASASAKNPKYRDSLEGPIGGFQVTPYIELMAGAHAKDETVTNTTTKISEVVPEHSILRIYGGLATKAQFWRFQVSSDMSVFNLFDQETIGYTTKTGVAFRVLKGTQFHAKPDFTLYLDPAHHFGLDVTYENGRAAPNFEYLNTVNAGIKVIY